MDLKSLGVAIGGFGAIAGVSILRARLSRSLAESDEAPMTQKQIPPDVITSYDRAYDQFMRDKWRSYSDELFDEREKLDAVAAKFHAVRESFEGLAKDFDDASDGLRNAHHHLNDVIFDGGYVAEMTEFIGKHEPRDLARMRAHAAFVSRLGWDDAHKFAELAGESDPRKLLERWRR